jgi:hypothetical protein
VVFCPERRARMLSPESRFATGRCGPERSQLWRFCQSSWGVSVVIIKCFAVRITNCYVLTQLSALRHCDFPSAPRIKSPCHHARIEY